MLENATKDWGPDMLENATKVFTNNNQIKTQTHASRDTDRPIQCAARWHILRAAEKIRILEKKVAPRLVAEYVHLTHRENRIYKYKSEKGLSYVWICPILEKGDFPQTEWNSKEWGFSTIQSLFLNF